MARVLIIEDEEMIAETLGYNLQREGHEVSVAYDGEQGLRKAEQFDPDLVLLDLMLPGVDGLEVCHRLRATSEAAIVMLTGKAAEADRIIGLEVGADDYITKPFNMREVIARVRAVLRRRPSRPPKTAEAVLSIHGLTIDPAAREVRLGRRTIDLTLKEFELLHVLVASAGRVLSRDDLLQEVWGDDVDRDGHTLDVHIRRLREKLEVVPDQPRRLLTVRGVGYKFAS